MRSNPAHELFFIFQLENIFRSYLNFSTSYARLTDLKSFKGYYKWDFYGLQKNFHLNIYLSAGGRLSPHV